MLTLGMHWATSACSTARTSNAMFHAGCLGTGDLKTVIMPISADRLCQYLSDFGTTLRSQPDCLELKCLAQWQTIHDRVHEVDERVDNKETYA